MKAKMVREIEADVSVLSVEIPAKEDLVVVKTPLLDNKMFWVKEEMYSYGNYNDTFPCPSVKHSKFWVRPIIVFKSNVYFKPGDVFCLDGTNEFTVVNKGRALCNVGPVTVILKAFRRC